MLMMVYCALTSLHGYLTKEKYLLEKNLGDEENYFGWL
jgi:hypothetical protein